jgi:hypothetical protein
VIAYLNCYMEQVNALCCMDAISAYIGCVDSFINNSVSPFMEISYPHYGYYRSLGQKLLYTFCFAT